MPAAKYKPFPDFDDCIDALEEYVGKCIESPRDQDVANACLRFIKAAVWDEEPEHVMWKRINKAQDDLSDALEGRMV